MLRQKPLSYFLFFISLLAYFVIAYGVHRHETVALFSLYFLLFGIYVFVIKVATSETLEFWILGAVLFRFVLLLALPNLSDDFYRFIWDGRLLANGIHPFSELPDFYLSSGLSIPGIDQALYDQLNSQAYFTIYPPLAQFIFWISALASPQSILGSVVVIRIFVLAAEIGSLFLIKRLLIEFNLHPKKILVYALNPLVILELTGNLHFEAFVILFLLLSLYLLYKSKIISAGISFGLAVGAKLLPLIFLPLFLIRLGLKRSILFYTSVFITCLLLFIPLLNSEILNGFGKSIGLYFKSFEFNASIYYLVREYGFLTKGYNIIQTVGWKLGLISGIAILAFSIWPYTLAKKEGQFRLIRNSYAYPAVVSDVPQVMMWVMFCYFLFTTTLHPWYITTLLMLSLFTGFRFMVLWSALIFLTYAGYDLNGFTENLYLTAFEYLLVIGYLVYEILCQKKYTYR